MEQIEYRGTRLLYRSAEKKCQTVATELFDAGNLTITHSRVYSCIHVQLFGGSILGLDFGRTIWHSDLFSPIQSHTHAYSYCFHASL